MLWGIRDHWAIDIWEKQEEHNKKVDGTLNYNVQLLVA